jgi:UDP-glucuronate decarboxylase
MRILVTGGAGFIGSHLIDRLMTEGHEVICLDNFYTGHRRNLLHWLNHPYFELIRHDVTEPIRLEVDQIYHLACPASPVHYQYNPVKTIKTNVLGTLNMLGLAKRVKARFLLSSTSEVYGDPEVHPQTEEYRGNVNPIGIRSCYDEGKRVAETLSFDYHRQNNVDIRVARIFNTYGPRMLENDGRVVSNFVVQALQGNPLTLYGSGSQTRSFCYVSDLVDGLMRLMNGDYIGPVNLGNPDEYTILELAQAVQSMVNPDAELVYKPLPQDDPQRRKPDITKAKTFLNWSPTVPLQEGLKLTISDFSDRMSQAQADPEMVPGVPSLAVSQPIH